MSQSAITPIIERDADQSDTPPGLVAYVLRVWGKVFTGVINSVSAADGKLALNFVAHPAIEASARPARFPAETSRIFAVDGAQIDPGVFEIDAGEPPDRLPE